MKKSLLIVLAILFTTTPFFAQENEKETKAHYNISKFKQLNEELPTPNNQHTASGAPGYEYTQQQVDYKIDLVLNDENQQIKGEETITYHNNSKDYLEYLWVQLDQNMRAPDSKSPLAEGNGPRPLYAPEKFASSFMGKPFQGGFNIEHVNDASGNPIDYMINRTMMRINLKQPLAPGATYVFNIKWWYNINNYQTDRGRSGYEFFEDGNAAYAIAQFYPRLAVYNNVEGWQNMQFWGSSEFALEFGNYEVSITTPSDFVLNGTGTLKNPKEVLTKTQYKAYQKAQTTYDKPIYIVTPEEALEASKGKSTKTKTWKLYAENVRDFAFATSKNYMWDGMAVKLNDKTAMAYSLYPKEGGKLWEEHSTRAVAKTLEVYSKHTFDYPYPHATSVNVQMGMEYPMICFNFGRADENGNFSERTKKGMIGVIIHEVGHNFFPMIVNSDERRWTWMDEGLDSFVEILAEYEYDPELFPMGKQPKDITRYMKGDQDRLAPIMSHGDNVFNFGANAYSKPAAGLFILRQTIMGPELFDHAFKTYANRWAFKHPTPADFFRTMEDASAMDLDWFWRGWFYTTGNNDIGIKEVKKYYVTDKPTKRAENMAKRYGITVDQLPPSLYLVSEDSEEFTDDLKTKTPENYSVLSDYINDNFSEEEKSNLKTPKYFYEVVFEKPGDLVMPIIVEFEYEDGTKERKQYPAQIWRKNDDQVTKVVPSSKAITKITVDPDEQTADVDTTNNSWPKTTETEFDKFKKDQIKG
ncbi:M1 family metallopeptidase [Lutibacter holmesii]|uniref:M1 family metallopeptidase n=1 Tax=Lutibacter holmesii TaxID=1137985 RepID=A0ABW3WJW3_9FLAO